MVSKISTAWIQHLGKEEKDKFLELLYNNHSNLILIRLKEIMIREREALEASELLPDYDSASWSHKQAHTNGARQTLKFVEDLLSFTSNKGKHV